MTKANFYLKSKEISKMLENLMQMGILKTLKRLSNLY